MSVLETLVEVALGDQEDFLKIKETCLIINMAKV